MDTLTHVTDQASRESTGVALPGARGQALSVSAVYHLSDEGRKASLLAGGDGRAVQRVTLDVPAHRLHLVTVDAEGQARLKLQPRFERRGDAPIERIDGPPSYDAPVGNEELFRAAAQNYELERAYAAEREAARAKRRETGQSLREQLAQGFLADPTMRAVAHPPPTAQRCQLAARGGMVTFDVAREEGLAKQVPPEAHRRFRADLRSRTDRNRQIRAEQLAVHEEKKRAVGQWIEAYGSVEQRARHAAGMFPMEEAVVALTNQAFAPAAHLAVYDRANEVRLQAHLRRFPQWADVLVSAADITLTSQHAVSSTREQWAFVNELRQLIPLATVVLRAHKVAWTRDHSAPTITVFGVLVTLREGPFVLRREFML